MAMAMVSCPSCSASVAQRLWTGSVVGGSPQPLRVRVVGISVRRIAGGRVASSCGDGGRYAVAAWEGRGREWGLASTAQIQGNETASKEEELPAKLCEIVRLFQAVKEQRSRYQQLLYYGQKMKGLAKEYQVIENRVPGCVSQVWVICKLADDGRMYFEAESDSALSKGLAALLVEGLSGSTPAEILKVTPDFVQKLGLQQNLTPSRSNGFLNMLRLMQKKTMLAYRDSVPKSGAAAGVTSEVVVADDSGAEHVSKETVQPKVATTAVKESIQRKLTERLSPVELEVEDVSHQHTGSSETHFNVKVVSDGFQGLSLSKRHRLIYGLLEDELKNGLHALSLITKTPAEISTRNAGR